MQTKLLKSFFHFFLTIIFLITTVQKTFAASWLQPQSAGLLTVKTRPYISCQFWNKQGQIRGGDCFNAVTLDTNFEYGVLPWFTFVINPIFNYYSQAGNFSPFAPGNLMAAARFQLWKNVSKIVSVQIGYTQKFKSSYLGSAGDGITPSEQIGLISEQNYMDIRFMFGTSGIFKKDESTTNTVGTPRTTQPNTWYADFELAFQPYFTGAANQFQIDFIFGWKFLQQKWVLEFKELNSITLNNPRLSIDPNFNLFSIVGSITYWFNTYIGLQGGMQQAFFGTNIGLGISPFVTFLWQF